MDIKSLAFKRNEQMLDVDCKGIMKGNKTSIKYTKSRELQSNKNKMVQSDEEVASWAKDCSDFKHSRKYITTPMSVEEEEYSLAYIISTYKDLQSFEHLLRSIYQPQNIYCVHVDQKSDENFKKRIADIVRCFDNVFLASKMVKVYYTHWSIVQSSLNCMEDLVKRDRTWKYVMNLCAYDHPIQTNLQIVRSLKKLGGKNSATTYGFRRFPNKRRRYNQKYRLPGPTADKHAHVVPTGEKKDPAPHNIIIFTGSDYIAFRREAIEYLVQDKKIQDFIEWAKDTFVADELVWPTLQRMYPEFPGSVPPEPKYDMEEYDAIVRFRTWGGPCDGKIVRWICIYGSGDLHRFVNDKRIFLNKVAFDVDPIAIECLRRIS